MGIFKFPHISIREVLTLSSDDRDEIRSAFAFVQDSWRSKAMTSLSERNMFRYSSGDVSAISFPVLITLTLGHPLATRPTV